MANPEKCHIYRTITWGRGLAQRIPPPPCALGILSIQLLDAKNKPQENQDNDFSTMHKKV